MRKGSTGYAKRRQTFSAVNASKGQANRDVHRSKKDKSFVHFGNDNWNLVLHMLFGIRQSVHSVMHEAVYQLNDREFAAKFRYELEAIPVKNK